MNSDENKALPIGVFDSGLGGLTVLAGLKKHLPNESYIYLGDMARLPYGTKSPRRVASYAHEISQTLTNMGIKFLVVACNTASTVALSELRDRFPYLPMIGVVEPGAESALLKTQTNNIAVLATQTTIEAEGYQKALLAKSPMINVMPQACSLFVALAEEGLVSGDIVRAVVKYYLQKIRAKKHEVDCVILGCTHFPVLLACIKEFLGDDFLVVDSAQACAHKVREILEEKKLIFNAPNVRADKYFVTDSADRFLRLGPLFLGGPIDKGALSLIEL